MTRKKHEVDKSHVMVGTCPNHGLVAGDAINGEFPNVVTCAGCGKLLDKCISAQREPVEENDDVIMEFEE